MDQHLVFAISREYGSGGREIGERLASELGIAYYDKLLLKRIAEESGLSGDVVEDFDEKPMRPLLLNPNSFFCGTDIEHPVASRIYKTEVDILRSIANEGPCVIVGRCADYVLEGHPGLVSLFVSAPMEARVRASCGATTCPRATHAAASHAWTRTAPATIATSPTRTGGRRETTTCASTPATWTRWERSL